MPCDITFWGRPENEQEVLQRMRRHGYMLRTFREPVPPKNGMSSGTSAAMMNIGRPPSIKISHDQVGFQWSQCIKYTLVVLCSPFALKN